MYFHSTHLTTDNENPNLPTLLPSTYYRRSSETKFDIQGRYNQRYEFFGNLSNPNSDSESDEREKDPERDVLLDEDELEEMKQKLSQVSHQCSCFLVNCCRIKYVSLHRSPKVEV
jgi:hypothetical protein